MPNHIEFHKFFDLSDIQATPIPSEEIPSVGVVCLIGSSRFRAKFVSLAEKLEKEGNLVLMMGFMSHSDGIPVSRSERDTLWRVDRFRLNLTRQLGGRVIVVNAPRPYCHCGSWGEMEEDCGMFQCLTCTRVYASPKGWKPYIGEDTRKEIEYAQSLGLPISYMERVDNV